MRYISLDIETTGLDPLTCDILEVGAVIEDTNISLSAFEVPCFHKYLWKNNYCGEPYALAMNTHIFQSILELKRAGLIHDLITPDNLWEYFRNWLISNQIDLAEPITIAGKNVVGFDIPFLNRLPGWKDKFKFHRRVIDPAVLYFDPHNDKVLPDLKECKRRAGLPDAVSHTAFADAWDVIQLVRAKFPPMCK